MTGSNAEIAANEGNEAIERAAGAEICFMFAVAMDAEGEVRE